MNFINKINKYLIERYPTIWNTRIVWMLAINILVHILFYIIGYFSHTSPTSFQYGYVLDDYFRSGFIMVHIIISMLLLVGWLVAMFKNNGFKNFYPTSNIKLFGQFVCYLVIIFCSITFYFSYMFGLRSYVNATYTNSELAKNVEIINKAYPFLSLDYQKYELNKRAYPKLFTDLYIETGKNYIDYNKKYYESHGNYYQFYSLYKVAVTEKDENRQFKYPATEYKNGQLLAYETIKNDTCYYYFKKDVVDVSANVKTPNLSYYNFSEVFYKLDSSTIDYFDRYNYNYSTSPEEPSYYGADPNIGKNYAFNKELTEILDRKDPVEIKKILSDFLEVSKKYQIENNLTVNTWFKLIYHPENFEVKKFILESESSNAFPEESIVVTVDTLSNTTFSTSQETVNAAVAQAAADTGNGMHDFFRKNITSNYYKIRNLNEFLRGVELVKNVDFVSKNIHIYIWIAFFLSTLIFSFRVTNLRSVIFTGISTGVLSLSVGLIALVYSISISNHSEFFVAYLVLFIATIILLIPLLFKSTFSKLFTSIFMNMSINGFVLYVFLILGIISMHQNEACRSAKDYYSNYSSNCTTILEYLDINTSYLLLAVGLLFMLIYTAVIKKWRATPE